MDVEKAKKYGGKGQITSYVEHGVKRAFEAMAKEHGLSASALMGKLVRYSVGQRMSQGERLQFSEVEKKDYVLGIRLTEGEGQRVEYEAAQQEMKPSAYGRMLLKGAITQDVTLSDAEMDELRKIRAQLSKIGTNLNTAVKLAKINPYAENPLTEDLLSEALQEIKLSRDLLQAALLKNKGTWANLYGQEG